MGYFGPGGNLEAIVSAVDRVDAEDVVGALMDEAFPSILAESVREEFAAWTLNRVLWDPDLRGPLERLLAAYKIHEGRDG